MNPVLIFEIDDALKALRDLHNVIVKAASEEKVMIFRFAAEAFRTMETGLRSDIVFSDIKMPGLRNNLADIFRKARDRGACHSHEEWLW